MCHFPYLYPASLPVSSIKPSRTGSKEVSFIPPDIKQEPSSPLAAVGGGQIGVRRWGEGEKGACLYEGRGRQAGQKKDERKDLRYSFSKGFQFSIKSYSYKI